MHGSRIHRGTCPAASDPTAFAVEPLERRVLMSADVRSIDGAGNNLANADWGSTGEPLVRLVAAGYADGRSAPAGALRPSARAISNAVASQDADDDVLSPAHLSAFAYLWGQFIDHDLDLTTTSSANGTLNVPVPTGDPSFDPLSTGTQVIPLSRSNYVVDSHGVRQQVNDITAYLDGSMVYGSDPTRAAALRTFVGGQLKTSAGNLLPLNTAGLANANDAHLFPADQLFLAGDVRANENSELTALQTLFVREHNRLAAGIASRNRGWSDEQVYQAARRVVIGEIENITYNEYLPALLGRNAMPRYTGYKSGVNAGISNEFSTAAFRLGHSMLPNDVEFLNNDGTTAATELELADVFFNPTIVQTHGIDTTLKYLASSNAQEIDTKVVDSLRNFLFGAPGSGGLDLASLNIQRGRDHGLASYNDTRVALGLPRLTKFSQVSSDPAVVAKLASVYASVDDVDLWVGGLAEDHVAGSNLGPTFQRVVVDQFTRTRDGDRFWFERSLSGSELRTVRDTSLADVVMLNSKAKNLQADVFVFDATIGGWVYGNRGGGGGGGGGRDRNPKHDLSGMSNVTVNLVDPTGAVVDTTKTDRNGEYLFDYVQVGTYRVVPVAGSGQTVTAPTTWTVKVTKGDDYDEVNFSMAYSGATSNPHGNGPHGNATGGSVAATDVLDQAAGDVLA